MADHACHYKGEALLLTEERDRAEQRIKELEAGRNNAVDRFEHAEARLAAAERVVRAARTYMHSVRSGDRDFLDGIPNYDRAVESLLATLAAYEKTLPRLADLNSEKLPHVGPEYVTKGGDPERAEAADARSGEQK